ncbi:hypothetical protein VTN77DRAFT_7972 [Rasamsonia byssochlamydoides]|uniref:uncharacterized protein n=1 Tax=Rasamsonia byssochlamydoides TaxID=89139 RepID=UPI0037439B5D
MASQPSRRTSLRLDLSQASLLESPPEIAALFLIRFDIKTGYVVAWKNSLPGVELEGAVEYKSLPSGLHNVTDDLVYFVHDQYAGISAFVNQPAAEAERNALMLAVGVLVPLSFGRLGKSWRHAAGLKELAKKCAEDVSDTQPLVDYWEKHRAQEDESITESPPDSPATLRAKSNGDRPDSLRRGRRSSEATALETTRPVLAPFHPALSLPDFVDAFGPLVFPLYRASLLRKRILLVTEAPVQTSCDYVYDLALLSSLPQSLLPLLRPEGIPPLRPRPLFNVGVHDIPFLSSFAKAAVGSELPPSWIACTTDNVLTMKSELYDVLVTLPPSYSKNATQKVYPKISVWDTSAEAQKSLKQTPLKATQRDARRFVTLREGLRRLPRNDVPPTQPDDDNMDAASTFSSASIVEPVSWPRLAYTSFMWWASAGEKRTGISEEEEEQTEQDTSLLASVDSPTGTLSHQGHLEESNQPQEIALFAYFRRLTTLIFTTLSDAVARQDAQDHDGDDSAPGYQDEPDTVEGGDDDHGAAETAPTGSSYQEVDANEPLLGSASQRDSHGEAGERAPVLITASDMTQMGLDPWSTADRIFVEELLRLWWGRKARVDGTRIRCCGIPIL